MLDAHLHIKNLKRFPGLFLPARHQRHSVIIVVLRKVPSVITILCRKSNPAKGTELTGNKKRTTCLGTLLQNELNTDDVARFTTHVQTC